MSISMLTRKNNVEPSHLRDIDENEIFVLKQHLYTDGKHYCLRRNFRLSSIRYLITCRTNDDCAAVCYFADIINKFITDEGKDESKTSDEDLGVFNEDELEDTCEYVDDDDDYAQEENYD